MTKKPFFSIVIPALNEEKYLPLLLNDLSKQTIDDFEVIIIDGQSSDKTVENSQKYATKLPALHILTSKIRNVSIQRNMGAEAAVGEYIIFNDADNRIPVYFLEGVRYQLRVQQVDLFTTWSSPDSDKNADKTITNFFNMMLEASQIAGTPSAFGAMIGCRLESFPQTGGFKPEIGFAEDTDFVRTGYKAGLSFKVFRDPRYVYSLRRFHKLGTIRIIQKSAILNLKYLTGQKVDQKKEYPMGGSHLEKNKQTVTFLSGIEKSIRKASRKQVTRIKSLLNLEEE